MTATIYSYHNGNITLPLNEVNLARMKTKDIWIDLKEPDDTELELLQKKLKIHPTTIEDIKAHNSRTKIEEFPTYLSVVISDIIKKKDEFIPSEIDLIIGKNFIITASENDIKELEDLKINRRKFAKLLYGGSDSMLYYILDSVMNHYPPLIEDIDDEVDKLETAAIQSTDRKVLNQILDVRSRIILIRKLIHPQRQKMGFLTKGQYKFIRADKLPYFRDLYDDTFRLSESIESSREEISSVYDIYMSTISYNTNEVMKVLSIAATIVLPLTFITGVFGMNFRYMPWLNEAYGFWATVILMVGFAFFLIMYFKKQKWL